MEPDDDEKNPNLATTLTSVAIDAAKLVTDVPLEYTDILPGLQTGLIDAVPTAPFYALAGQFYIPAAYMLEMNYSPLVGGLVINRKTWDALTEAERAALTAAARQSGQKLTTAARAESEAALETLRQRGITITRLLPPAQAAFITAVQPMTARWSAVIGEDLVKAAETASRAAVP